MGGSCSPDFLNRGIAMPQSYFDHDPANYDRARPRYPDELFDELVNYIGAGESGIDAVEIGPGTGQATCDEPRPSSNAIAPVTLRAATARRWNG